MRKYYDPAGRPGASTCSHTGALYVDTSNVPLTFGARFLEDVRNRTETAISQARSFLVTRLATEAQLHARKLGVRQPAALAAASG